MKEAFKKMLAGLLESKRFRVFLLGKGAALFTALAMLLLAKLGVEDEEIKGVALDLAKQLPAGILMLTAAWVGGQSISDIGKGKAQAEAEAAKPSA